MCPSSPHKHILDLPAELLTHIFTFIPYNSIDDVRLVCPIFKEVGEIALKKGFNWIRRQTANIIHRLESEEEDDEDIRKRKRRGRQSKRSKLMEMNWRYRRYQSFIIIICLSRLFIATFSSLISSDAYPICPASLIDLYFQALEKSRLKPSFISKLYQRAIYDQTLLYKSKCDAVLLNNSEINTSAVLHTIIETLQCFPLKDTALRIEGKRINYVCSLPGCWFQIFRHNGDSSVKLSPAEVMIAMSCLYTMVTSSIAQCTGAEYLDDNAVYPFQHWEGYTIYSGTNGFAPCYLPLVFEFVIPYERKFAKTNTKITDIESDDFLLKISSPVHATIYFSDCISTNILPSTTSYMYQTPNFTEPSSEPMDITVTKSMSVSPPCMYVSVHPTKHNKRKRLVSVSSSSSSTSTDAKVLRLS